MKEFNTFSKNTKLSKFIYMKSILFFICISANIVFSQNLNFITEFGKFKSANSFAIDLNSNFYVADQMENSIYKLDSLGNKIIEIGGYGWESSTFDNPSYIFTNTLSVYVADKNNNRIQRFDKDLNFISEYNGSDENSELGFAYPICVVISRIGDLFILDSDNNRILKFNLTGEYLYEIGGNNAGNLAINNPKNFTIDANGNLYVLDENDIKIFDEYGNGQFKIDAIIDAEKIKYFNHYLWIIKKDMLVKLSLLNRKNILEFNYFPNINDEEIKDIEVRNGFLFVLTTRRIIKYKILN